ncbi:hypothetical protein WJX81_003456 [Elliptochloris bilobata]|uniref:Phospholipid/glycerol acyltransferase domain-containing protein n=1 Tax=Elliptochloris bilobata TaxID=381761 RepID=A0AAW1RFU8_9CHLO
MNLVKRFLDLPAFLIGVFFLYWSLPLAVLMNKVKFWKLNGKRNDARGWSVALRNLFRVKMLRLPGPALFPGGCPVLFLSNHRSWADFYLDVVATDGNAQMLARMAVAYVFPMFMLAVCIIRSVILFKRGKKVDHEEFNRMLEYKMAASPVDGLIVYPEGHRSIRCGSLPLKRGMLVFAFSRKMPVQIVMSANKEAVISEKEMRCGFGQRVLVGYSEVIRSTDFKKVAAFTEAVQAEWDRQWHRVYTADWSTAEELCCDGSDTREYSWRIKAMSVGSTLMILYIFVSVLFCAYQLWVVWLSLFGPWGRHVATLGVALWVSVSVARAFEPLQLPRERAQTAAAPPDITSGAAALAGSSHVKTS